MRSKENLQRVLVLITETLDTTQAIQPLGGQKASSSPDLNFRRKKKQNKKLFKLLV